MAPQGHVLSAGDLLTTLAVEATVHHLDLIAALPSPLNGLLGRAPLTAAERAAPGPAADRFPLFG
ncbi:hypothetical protein BIV25_35300 [Streptomyces sp. MUSC 14]|uniref:hypothetical protein n=1 Tax=Streptomyces sp. MUSC 14 TaxID=1354889 RepID=UPI0008F58AE7|nr:hypothetical protein [Streptomyces sp. MUSC 14]OIJ88956.1 hypothetical protein BIV25_35300 [Streptomyces sp. MUSC 14]